MTCNFQMPFYRMDTNSLKVVYVNFHKPICHWEFFGEGRRGKGGGSTLSSNSSEMAWNFQMPFYRMDTDSLRMVYVNFHKPTITRDFSMKKKN